MHLAKKGWPTYSLSALHSKLIPSTIRTKRVRFNSIISGDMPCLPLHRLYCTSSSTCSINKRIVITHYQHRSVRERVNECHLQRRKVLSTTTVEIDLIRVRLIIILSDPNWWKILCCVRHTRQERHRRITKVSSGNGVLVGKLMRVSVTNSLNTGEQQRKMRGMRKRVIYILLISKLGHFTRSII